MLNRRRYVSCFWQGPSLRMSGPGIGLVSKDATLVERAYYDEPEVKVGTSSVSLQRM